jgi:hypothetical protein
MDSSLARPVSIPSWISLGQIVTGIGAILIFIGFLFGYVAVSNLGSTNYQNALELFFVLTGFGILLTIGGWLFDSIWPKFQSRPHPGGTSLPPPPPPPPP